MNLPSPQNPAGPARTAEPPPAEWTSADGSLRVVYPAGLFEQIRSETVMAMHGIGGARVEVGGILLGTQQGAHYRLADWRKIHCDYSRGSTFLLSDRDIATLSCQVEALGVDPALAGFEVLGWFVSHIRGGLEPRAEEAQLHLRIFSRPHSLMMVIHPSKFGDADIGFNVVLGGEPPTLETKAPPLGLLPAPGAAPAPGEPRREAVPLPEPEPVRPSGGWRRRLAWASVIAGAAFVVLGFMTFRAGDATRPLTSTEAASAAPAGSPVPLLSLHIERVDDALRISWDAASSVIREASGGELVVLDREERFIRPLNADELRLGKIDYTRSAGEIRVQLTVRAAGGVHRELAHYQPQQLYGEDPLER